VDLAGDALRRPFHNFLGMMAAIGGQMVTKPSERRAEPKTGGRQGLGALLS